MQPDPTTKIAHMDIALSFFKDETEYQNQQELKREFGDDFRKNSFNAPFKDAGPFVTKKRELVLYYQLRFAPLKAGEAVTFNMYYGAASTQSTALNEMQAVGAETYAFAWDLPPENPHGAAGTVSGTDVTTEILATSGTNNTEFVEVGKDNTECASNHDSSTFMIGVRGVKY